MPNVRHVSPEAFDYEARIASLESQLAGARSALRENAKDAISVIDWEIKRIGVMSLGTLRAIVKRANIPE